MHVLVIELPGDGTQVKGPGTLDEMRAAAREHAGADLIESGWPNDAAVETLCVEGGDVTYAIHKLEGKFPTIVMESTSDAPEIEITAENADQWSGSGGGPQVAEIDVIHADKYSRFFVSVGINRRGQAVCEVATNKADLRTTRKTVVATRKRPLADHCRHGD